MDAEQFKQITGMAPENDDLERVNCPQAGQVGHGQCGVCACGKPRFLCGCQCQPAEKLC